MPNQPAAGLKTIHIRIEEELKNDLVETVEKLNRKYPAANYSQASIIRSGLESELKKLKKLL